MRDKKLKTLKVLLVEDEQAIAELLKSAIGDNFRSFIIANDGLEGYELYSKITPDIIITDIMMPNSSGLELAKKIRLNDRLIPIIILSAFSEKEKLFGAIDAGVTKYFTKPYDPDEILEYIHTIASEIQEKTLELCDDFSFDKNNHSLYKESSFVKLSKNETSFITLLAESLERRLSYEDIKSSMWEDKDVSDERLRTFVKRLREKTSKNLIETIKGYGYRLNES
ncbi:response regulator transcription factor [Sulfurimonas lithotrophica]|uniref:Response regulator transcription factor n=1 Tax=Sulfurimonas lithotrophica TaxID=2590022 RepID=A0A5P8NZ59_9BACT|nr:response regulator transcription factor [Sulfurimonas lithotrophica]QFR48729.1 response regulator transcription factor [Sulfurimonas lithotrophica]